jgi:hypothetical protein
MKSANGFAVPMLGKYRDLPRKPSLKLVVYDRGRKGMGKFLTRIKPII